MSLPHVPAPWLLPLVLGLGLAAGACGKPEVEAEPDGCRSAEDCEPGEVCESGACVREEPPGCHPPCGGALPVCDEERGFCKVCTPTAGCGGGTPFCLPAANGGEGLCVACRDDGDCVAPALCDPARHACVGCTETEGCGPDAPVCWDGTCVACTEEEGCGGETPICDTSVPGGACVACTEEAGCGEGQVCDRAVPAGACVSCTAERGCGGETPVCDTSVPGGECVECATDGDCSDGRLCAAGRCVTCDGTGRGCSPPEPHCDVTADGGRGACVGCLGDEDCSSPTPLCHPERQSCVACLSNLDCAMPTRVCDPEAEDGAGACVACVDDGDCGGPKPVCDRAAADGVGECVACTEERGCGRGTFCTATESGPACVTCTETRGCAGSTPLCDTSVPGGTCVTCIDDGDCTADAGRPLCDRARAGGRGACVACTLDHRGCGGTMPYCHTDANWGAGVCLRCLPGLGCGGDKPVCDLSAPGAACVVCTATEGCGDLTPYCDTSVSNHACRTCLADGTGCPAETPLCEPLAAGGLGTCVACRTSADCDYFQPVCEPTLRKCVDCTATEGCRGTTPVCLEDPAGPLANRCVECLETAHCDVEVEACIGVDCVDLASQSIAEVRGGTGAAVYRATVTYLKPAVPGEPAGFFLQSERLGPGLFVAVDPAGLSPPPAPGDRVSFDVVSSTTVDGMFRVTGLAGWQVSSSGHDPWALEYDIFRHGTYPALATRESTLAAGGGTLYGFAPDGPGFVSAAVDPDPPGGGPRADVRLRLPESLWASLQLGSSCRFSVTGVPVWRSGSIALPTAYRADELYFDCPDPMRASYAWAIAPLEARVLFDRRLAGGSVLADGSQFTITPALQVIGARVLSTDAQTVTLTTAPQTPNTTYTISVAGTVLDEYGTPVDTTVSPTFQGFGGP
jgi:hypothetical protein